MAAIDYTDFYILDPTDRKFQSTELIEDEFVRNVIQKYLMIIYTNNEEVMGDRNFGGNLLELLYETRISGSDVQELINRQILNYIPEIVGTPFSLNVLFEQDPENYQDIMFIFFNISEFEIVNQIGRFS